MYEDRKLKEIMRREKELEAKLHSQRKSSRRVSSSSDDSADETVNMADEWDRENQEILDNSMMMDTKTSRKRRNVPKKVRKELFISKLLDNASSVETTETYKIF